MKELSHYDDAVADQFKKSNSIMVPVLSWEFNHQFLEVLQGDHADFQRIQKLALNFNWRMDWDLKKRLQQQTVIVTDASLSIVFASSSMSHMNGYQESEVLGRTPKMFQGKDTDLQTSLKIRIAIQHRQPFEETILNYKKDGSTYFCAVKGFPVFDKRGELCHFIAFETAA